MARQSNKLSDVQLRRSTFKPGVHSDGGGLYLRVSKTGARAWVYIYTRRGVRREAGLGSSPATSLAMARDKARLAREALAAGLDPIAEKKREAPPTLAVLTERFVEEFQHTVVPKLAQRWRSLVKIHAADLCSVHVDRITTNEVVAILKAAQKTNPASAKHLRGLLARIFDFAKILGFRTDNPAMWQSHLALVMAPLGAPSEHVASMPHGECPAFFAALREDDTNTKAAMRFLILTATRTREVTGMTWGEIDADARIWNIPPSRTKNRKGFAVPLSSEALAIMDRQRVATGGQPKPADLVFAGRFKGRSLSAHTLLRFLGDTTAGRYTCHGFRATFRQWGSDMTDHPSELLERCLNHSVGSAVSQAYDRSTYIDKRRVVLDDWSAFVAG